MRIFRAAAALLIFSTGLRAEESLTLEQSLQRALHNNQKLLSAQNKINIAKQRVRQAKSQYYPQVILNMNGSRYLAEQNFVLPAEFGSTLLRPSKSLEPDTFYSARGWLRQPIYNGGRSRNTILLAEADLERANIQREDIHGQVVFEATRAFYDVLLERKRIALARESARRAEDLPGSPSVQLLRGRLRRDLAGRRRAAEKSHLAFLDALGVELYSSLDVSGELSTQPVDLDLAVLLARAQQSRPEIRQTGYQQEIDRLAVNLSLAERYPIVALGAGYELNDRKFPLETTQWNASVNVSLPLFDGFANRAQIRQRRLQANESRIRRTEVEDSINFEVRESYGDLMHWQEELALRRAEMERAETAARAAGRSGDAPALEAWLLETRDAYWTAVHGHVVALAKLEKAVGRPLKE